MGISSIFLPKQFDEERYFDDPEDYISRIEPGRVFQPKQPGRNVQRIDIVGKNAFSMIRNETVSFRVRAISNAPVSFTSFDLGTFENGLSAITVKADGDGIAEVQFKAGNGSFNQVNILAASPMTSGQAKYIVTVEMPRTAKELN